VAAQQKLEQVTIPQTRSDAESTLSKAKADLDTAQANFDRQQQLLEKGYVSQASVDQARAGLEGAKSSYNSAQQRAATIDREIAANERSAQMDTARALASLTQAKASSTDTSVAKTNVAEAEENVRQARIALDRAISEQMNNQVRQQDLVAAQASTVRSKVSLQNAKVQLESTTVVAPRGGVVTQKYLEEGTIIPPGTSTFSQGTSLVQISDVSDMFVECAVDEADVGSVAIGQRVRITTEAFPDERLRGEVDRINPAAATTSNVTSVQVRVHIRNGYRVPIKPGMNATCEFITMEKRDVLVVPSQAIRHGANGDYVLLKSGDPKKPRQQPVKVGEEGNDGVEVISGLKEGDQVVTAELNIAELKQIQEQMQQDQSQSGGLASGPNFGRNQGRGSTSGARGRTGGGSRSSGGGGGGGGGRG
jgi:HlyD family secretion protein